MKPKSENDPATLSSVQFEIAFNDESRNSKANFKREHTKKRRQETKKKNSDFFNNEYIQKTSHRHHLLSKIRIKTSQ